jgi:hypothetical protein
MKPTSFPPAKPRIQGPLERMGAEQRAVLHYWMSEGLDYKEIVRRCQSELGCKTSTTSLSGYYRRHHAEITRSRRSTSESVSAETGIELEVTLRLQVTPQLTINTKSAAVKIVPGGE